MIEKVKGFSVGLLIDKSEYFLVITEVELKLQSFATISK